MLIAEDTLLVVLVAAMVVMAALQIVLRNFWDSGIAWGDPLLRIAVMWVGLLGAMVATRQDKHIRIDVLSRYLSPPGQYALRVLTDLFAAAVCAALAYHGARFALLDWQDGIRAFAQVPAWLCEIIIPIGFAVMALRFALGLITPLNKSRA